MSYQLILRSTLLATACIGPVQAEQPVPLSTVTVTANKIDENIKQIPQSVTVIDDIMLEERRISNVEELIQQIPNMFSVSDTTDSSVNIRGINSSTFTRNNPVTLYIDGIPTSSRYAYQIPLTNIERVEVLRSPQGTLYGKDSIGGVINIISKKPDDYWQGNTTIEVGNFDARKLTFSASGPIQSDLLSASVWGEFSSDEGWIDNSNASLSGTGNDDEDSRFGVNLHLTPENDKFSARLQLAHETDNKGAHDGTTFLAADFEQAKRSSVEDLDYDVNSFRDTKTNSQGLYLEYLSDAGKFESITTHRKSNIDAEVDVDYGANAMYNGKLSIEDLSIKTITQELRWSHQLDSGFRWVAGLYYEDEQTDFDRFGSTAMPFPISNSKNNSDTSAVFGQLTLPMAEKLELTLGIRQQKIEKDIDHSLGLNAERSWTTSLPKAAINYRVSDNVSTYASVSKGYLPGGFNFATINSSLTNNQFKSQESLNYEIGAKANLLNGRLFVSTSAFHMDIKDIHAFTATSFTSPFITTNIDKARSYGFETELDFVISNQWQMNFAVGITNAEYRSDLTNVFFGDVKAGNKVENTPSRTINLGLQYNGPSGFYGRADLVNHGKIHFDAANTLEENGYTVANLNTGYEVDDWKLYAYINNVTDADYKTSGSRYPFGPGFSNAIATFGNPREFGLGAKYGF